MELDHLDKDSLKTRKRKALQDQKRFFRLETLKNCILNQILTTDGLNQGTFPQIRAISNFRKGAGGTSPL